MDERLRGVEVVHLTFSPPYAPGSFNPLVAALLDGPDQPRQVAISHGHGLAPAGAAGGSRTVLLSGPPAGSGRRAAMRLPERLRPRLFRGMSSPERIRYALGVASLLEQAQPAVVVVWDDYKLGPFLREVLGDTTTLVLSQHGRTYHLAPDAARDLYRLASFDAVITLTHASYQVDREHVYAYEPMVYVRPNGVDLRRFRPADRRERTAARVRWGLPEDRLVVLALARLAPSKGTHLLLHSWPQVLARVPDALLWLVGDGDPAYERRLRRNVAGLGIADHVQFEGAVAWADVPACHAGADVYAFPSVQDEGHPLSLLEAMASGLACVVSDSPVVRELHADAVDLVADPNIEDAFVEPLTRVLTDEEHRASLGQQARAQVIARFSLDDYLEDLGRFLSRLTPTPRAGPS